MNNAVGSPQSVLVLGGTSEIALCITSLLVSRRTRRVVLAGRNPETLESAAKELSAKGADQVQNVSFDAADPESAISAVQEAFSGGDIDLVIVAVGVLGNQEADEHDPLETARIITTNFTGPAAAGLAVADRMRAQGHGGIVVLSSVAGERPRKANFIYGSSKAGLDAFFQGLGDALVGSGVTVTVVRPGFVHTRMTAGMDPAPLSTTPEAVAADVLAGLRRGAHTVWSPGPLRWFMCALRHLPRPVFRRLPR